MTIINVEQALINHETIKAKHVVALGNAAKDEIIDRLNKLEAQKALQIEVGDVASNDSGSVTNTALSDNDITVVIVPPSIFPKETITLIKINANQNLAILSAGLAIVSKQLSEFKIT